MAHSSNRALERIASDFLTEEDPDALEMFRALRPARKRGHVTLRELKVVCKWKAARAIRHIERNPSWRVQAISRRALNISDEADRLSALCELHGVSVPMASAILTAISPRRYGVIDIRVWKVLYRLRIVSSNADGVGFNPAQWVQYLGIIRETAKRLRTTPRAVDHALYNASIAHQRGRLYARPSRSTAQGR